MPPIHVRPLTPADYAALSVWTDTPVDEIRRDVEDHHAEPRDRWLAWDGDHVVGALFPWRSPDGRLRLFFERCRDDAWEPLLAQVSGPAVTTVSDGDGDDAKRAALERLGFRASRTEWLYDLPARTHNVPLPTGIEVVGADTVPVEDVMTLDILLRDEIPGTDGWSAAVEWFREENHDSPYFDPACYLIARAEGMNIGLVRVWNGPRPLPRLGMVGVLPAYRGRGVASALLARVLTVWAQRGGTVVTAEVDSENAASNGLIKRFGGTVTGSETELTR